MNKDEIKKALECCSENTMNNCKNCPYYYIFNCNDTLCKDALTLITEQEKEIEYRKKQYDNQVSENTRLYIEYDKLKDDYAKLQELFAQYQMASDKEIRAQKKQAKIDVLNELKEKTYVNDYCREVVEIEKIDELIREYEE